MNQQEKAQEDDPSGKIPRQKGEALLNPAESEATEKYRTLLNNIIDVYYATPDCTLLEISPSTSLISRGQITREDVPGRSFLDFYAIPGERDLLLAEVFKNDMVTGYEVPLLNKDGSIVPVAISSALLYDASGNPVKIAWIVRDITDRKRSEELLKQSEAALTYSREIVKMGSWEME